MSISESSYKLKLTELSLRCKIPCYEPINGVTAKVIRGRVISASIKSDLSNKRGTKTNFGTDLAICEMRIRGYSDYVIFQSANSLAGGYRFDKKGYFKGIDRVPMAGMKGSRRQFPISLKIKVAERFMKGEPANKLRSEFGISTSSIERWVLQFQAGKLNLSNSISISLR